MSEPMGNLQQLLSVLVKLHTKGVASFASHFNIPLSALHGALSGRRKMSEKIQKALSLALAVDQRGFVGKKIESWLVKDAADIADLLALGVVLKPWARIKTSTEAAGGKTKQTYMLLHASYGATQRFVIARMSFEVLKALQEWLDTEAGGSWVVIDTGLSPELHEVSETLGDTAEEPVADAIGLANEAVGFLRDLEAQSRKAPGYLAASDRLRYWMHKQRTHRVTELTQGSSLPMPFTLEQIHDLVAAAYGLEPQGPTTPLLKGIRNDGLSVDVDLMVMREEGSVLRARRNSSPTQHLFVVRKIGDYGFECLFQGPFAYIDAALPLEEPERSKNSTPRGLHPKVLFKAWQKVRFEEMIPLKQKNG